MICEIIVFVWAVGEISDTKLGRKSTESRRVERDFGENSRRVVVPERGLCGLIRKQAAC
jgi:hypothetical protein